MGQFETKICEEEMGGRNQLHIQVRNVTLAVVRNVWAFLPEINLLVSSQNIPQSSIAIISTFLHPTRHMTHDLINYCNHLKIPENLSTILHLLKWDHWHFCTYISSLTEEKCLTVLVMRMVCIWCWDRWLRMVLPMRVGSGQEMSLSLSLTGSSPSWTDLRWSTESTASYVDVSW